MLVLKIALVVLGCGAAGGFVNALLAGDLHLPHREASIYSPGWIGNVAIGAVAALIYWGLYGPLAKTTILGDGAALQASLTMSELAGSIVTGIAGGRILTSEVDKKVLAKARDTLVDIVDRTASRS